MHVQNYLRMRRGHAAPMPKRSAKKLDVPLPLRVTSGMREEIKRAGQRLHMEDADTLRFAAEIGLKALRIIDYDVAGAVVQDAIRRLAKQKVE